MHSAQVRWVPAELRNLKSAWWNEPWTHFSILKLLINQSGILCLAFWNLKSLMKQMKLITHDFHSSSLYKSVPKQSFNGWKKYFKYIINSVITKSINYGKLLLQTSFFFCFFFSSVWSLKYTQITAWNYGYKIIWEIIDFFVLPIKIYNFFIWIRRFGRIY